MCAWIEHWNPEPMPVPKVAILPEDVTVAEIDWYAMTEYGIVLPQCILDQLQRLAALSGDPDAIKPEAQRNLL